MEFKALNLCSLDLKSRLQLGFNPLGLTGQLFCPIDFKRYPHHV